MYFTTVALRQVAIYRKASIHQTEVVHKHGSDEFNQLTYNTTPKAVQLWTMDTNALPLAKRLLSLAHAQQRNRAQQRNSKRLKESNVLKQARCSQAREPQEAHQHSRDKVPALSTDQPHKPAQRAAHQTGNKALTCS